MIATSEPTSTTIDQVSKASQGKAETADEATHVSDQDHSYLVRFDPNFSYLIA